MTKNNTKRAAQYLGPPCQNQDMIKNEKHSAVRIRDSCLHPRSQRLDLVRRTPIWVMKRARHRMTNSRRVLQSLPNQLSNDRRRHPPAVAATLPYSAIGEYGRIGASPAPPLHLVVSRWVAVNPRTEYFKLLARNDIAQHLGTFRWQTAVNSFIDHGRKHAHKIPRLDVGISQCHEALRPHHERDVIVYTTWRKVARANTMVKSSPAAEHQRRVCLKHELKTQHQFHLHVYTPSVQMPRAASRRRCRGSLSEAFT